MRPTSWWSLGLLVATWIVGASINQLADALRSGAPSMACSSMRPFHGLHRSRPASGSQFFLRQSSLTYGPGQNVTVEIMTQSNGRHFRGFMVQSYNPLNGLPIGEFVPTDEAQAMSCSSSATHRNNRDKNHITITWRPPASGPPSAELSDAEAAQRQSLAALGNWLGLPTGSSGGLQKRSQDVGPNSNISSTPALQAPLKQVRFRATIVVSYSEFYTGFESSELSFERFDYSPGNQARTLLDAASAAATV